MEKKLIEKFNSTLIFSKIKQNTISINVNTVGYYYKQQKIENFSISILWCSEHHLFLFIFPTIFIFMYCLYELPEISLVFYLSSILNRMAHCILDGENGLIDTNLRF